MTIVDSLKAKGSTGGNTIAEAIKNLPMGGGEFVIHLSSDPDTEINSVDKTFIQIIEAIQAGKTPILVYSGNETTETGEYSYGVRYIFSSYECSFPNEPDNQEPEGNVMFCSTQGSTIEGEVVSFVVDVVTILSNNTVSYKTKTITPLDD